MYARVLSVIADPHRVQEVEEPYATNGYRHLNCTSGEAGRRELATGCWDLLVVDYALNDMSGAAFVNRYRFEHGTRPVIVLTHGLAERIESLTRGADAVMEVPLGSEELLVRSESLLRRFSPAHQPYPTIGDFEFSVGRPLLRFRGQPLHLSTKAYQVLLRLARQPNEGVGWGWLMAKPHGPETLTSLATTVWRLNKTLGPAGDGGKYIVGVRNKGYMLRV